MRRVFQLILLLATVGTASAGFASQDQAVFFWNDQVLNATRLSRNPPPIAAVHMATYHVAIFDAANSITRTHRGWLIQDPAPEGCDIHAAMAGAASTVLQALWGQSTNPRNFQTALERALAGIPETPGKAAGLAWGRQVAQRILENRSTSGWNKPTGETFSSQEQGKWRETPTGFRPAVTPQIAATRPFAMTSPQQFRAPPPPPIDSREYAEEIAFVAKVGSRDGAERTDYQTLSTPFWADDLGTATPAGHWNLIAQDLARRHQLGLADSIRLFALLNMACADAGISCWDTKFFYRTWRPETAIREADPKVCPLVVRNPEFIPNMAAPAHPDYTSGHSTFTGAATRLLARWFGTDHIEFTTTSDGLPGAVRTFKKLSEACDEVGMSRVYGGIHTMSANLAGQRAGVAIADWAFDTCLQPVRTPTVP